VLAGGRTLDHGILGVVGGERGGIEIFVRLRTTLEEGDGFLPRHATVR
jgi:hypothetical protein